MRKNIIKKQTKEIFDGYENARQVKEVRNPEACSEKSVKAATNRINPDEDSKDRG